MDICGSSAISTEVRPDIGSSSPPPDHDSTFHVIETPALPTGPIGLDTLRYVKTGR